MTDPLWPVARVKELPARVNLSALPIEQRKAAFDGLKREAPELAGFVQAMAAEFGKVELSVDPETADRVLPDRGQR